MIFCCKFLMETVYIFTVLTQLESGSVESYGTVPYGTEGADPKLDITRIEVVKCNQETVPYRTVRYTVPSTYWGHVPVLYRTYRILRDQGSADNNFKLDNGKRIDKRMTYDSRAPRYGTVPPRVVMVPQYGTVPHRTGYRVHPIVNPSKLYSNSLPSQEGSF